jgi:hypothetical protein
MKQVYVSVQTDPLIIACPLNFCILWLNKEVTHQLLLEQTFFTGKQTAVIEALEYEDSEGSFAYIDEYLYPQELNVVGVDKKIRSVLEYLVAKVSSKLGEVEVVMARQDIPSSSYYKSKFDASCLGSYLAKAISEYRREWVIDEVYASASAYSSYNWGKNRGRLTKDHAFTVCKVGISHLHIKERLAAVGDIFMDNLRTLDTETIMSRHTPARPPLWWEEVTEQPFGEVAPFVTGEYPKQFKEWLDTVRQEKD